MHKTNNFAYANIAQVIVDVLFLILTYGITYLLVSELTKLWAFTEYLWILFIFVPLWVAIMALRGMYDKLTFYYLDRVMRNVMLATFYSGLCLGTMFFFIEEISTSRVFIALFFLLCILIMFLERSVFGWIYQRVSVSKYTPRIILVCSSETWLLFQRYLKKTQIRYNIVGVVQVGGGEPIQKELNLGILEDLASILKNQVVDEVVLALPKEYDAGVEQYVHLCEKMGITVHIILNIYNLPLSHVRISMLGPLPMLSFNTVNLNPIQKALKRAMDVIGALVGVIFMLGVGVFIVPAIKLDSRGPIIFKQTRVGRNGREFNFYKFRTMRADAEFLKEELQAMNEHKDGLMFKMKDDPRITRVGEFLRKTSLDEMPQFFNVLRGDMSLVGTRPPMLEEVKLYHLEHLRRISIKPGVTGLWQISGRSDIKDFDEVVALDLKYIDNWSIWLDTSIMIKTIWQVWHRKSAY